MSRFSFNKLPETKPEIVLRTYYFINDYRTTNKRLLKVAIEIVYFQIVEFLGEWLNYDSFLYKKTVKTGMK